MQGWSDAFRELGAVIAPHLVTHVSIAVVDGHVVTRYGATTATGTYVRQQAAAVHPLLHTSKQVRASLLPHMDAVLVVTTIPKPGSIVTYSLVFSKPDKLRVVEDDTDEGARLVPAGVCLPYEWHVHLNTPAVHGVVSRVRCCDLWRRMVDLSAPRFGLFCIRDVVLDSVDAFHHVSPGVVTDTEFIDFLQDLGLELHAFLLSILPMAPLLRRMLVVQHEYVHWSRCSNARRLGANICARVA